MSSKKVQRGIPRSENERVIMETTVRIVNPTSGRVIVDTTRIDVQFPDDAHAVLYWYWLKEKAKQGVMK